MWVSCSRPPFLLSNTWPGYGQLDGCWYPRRSLEGVIDPGPQVSVGEEVPSQEGDQVGEMPPPPGSEFEELEQDDGDQGGPDLGEQGVGGGSHEGTDLQGVLELLEEDLDLPAFFVQAGHGGSSQAEVIGQEDQASPCFGIPVGDPPQGPGVGLSPGGSGQDDGLVRLNPPGRLATFGDAVAGVALEPGDEEDVSVGSIVGRG